VVDSNLGMIYAPDILSGGGRRLARYLDVKLHG